LTREDRHVEDVMLRLRLAEGLPLETLAPSERAAADTAVADGRLRYADGRVLLTLRGRLLADGVTRDLLS
jgi:oxygen-independent coproporphyrinogen-3 oxidase